MEEASAKYLVGQEISAIQKEFAGRKPLQNR